MEDIINNSNSDIDYSEFINEINTEGTSADTSTDSTVQEVSAEVCAISQEELTEEEIENRKLEALYNTNAWINSASTPSDPNINVRLISPEAKAKIRQHCIKAIQEKNNAKREARLRIQRMAFDQNIIDLSAPLENSDVQRLISLLTQDLTKVIDNCAQYINDRFTYLLRDLIPTDLKKCRRAFPEAVRSSPGFLYKAGAMYGDGHTFWVCPDLPYYFKQNSEPEIIEKTRGSKRLKNIDIAIKKYYASFEKRAADEIKYASIIYQKHVDTFYDLLKLNPFWFEALFLDIQKDLKDEE